MNWIRSEDLEKWALGKDCESELPLVIRRLITASLGKNSILKMFFPAGKDVNRTGYDGILESKEKTQYVPQGLSVWEIGTGNNPKKKANDDYEKRTTNPLEVDPSQTTFIFVTPRSWPGAKEWVNNKKCMGPWRDVRAYDSSFLEQWIGICPAVGFWSATKLHKYPMKGVIALDDWWEKWKDSTKPAISPVLLKAGRASQVEGIINWLNSGPCTENVQAQTSDEAIAFLASVISTMNESDMEYYFSRALVAENADSFRHITATAKDDLILVADFENLNFVDQAGKLHHVYIPKPPVYTENRKNVIELGYLAKRQLIPALMEIGLTDEQSEKLARDTGGSLSVLRRRLGNPQTPPEWAKPDTFMELIPVLFVESWNGEKIGDKQVLERLSNTKYDTFISQMKKWRLKQDSPILQMGPNKWRLVSPFDVFMTLFHTVSDETLMEFKKIVIDVFSTKDPSFDLGPEKRYMRSVVSDKYLYSDELRWGIAQTLVLIAVFGDKVPNGKIDSYSVQSWVDQIVRKLLKEDKEELWYSVSDVLPLIAEASPGEFLSVVEESLNKMPSHIMILFQENGSSLDSRIKCYSLISAIESLAWDPSFIGQTTRILAKLVSLNKDRKVASQLENSLKSILHIIHPSTYAGPQERLKALDKIMEMEPDVGWELLLQLIPHSYDSCQINQKMLWRDVVGFGEQLSNTGSSNNEVENRLEAIVDLVGKLLKHVGNDAKKWADVIDFMPELPNHDQEQILGRLQKKIGKFNDPYNELSEKIRTILSNHRSYPQFRSMSEPQLQKLEDIYTILQPNDLVQQYSYLFNDFWPKIPAGLRVENEKTEKRVEEFRVNAIRDVIGKIGLEGIITMASAVKYPHLIGYLIPKVGLTRELEEYLLSLLAEQNDNKINLAKAYVHACALEKGQGWVDEVLNSAEYENWGPEQIVNFFVALPENKIVWELVENFGKEISKEYWNKFQFQSFNLSNEELIYMLRMLLTVGRALYALEISANISKNISPSLIAEILEGASLESSISPLEPDALCIENLFEILYASDEISPERMVSFEEMYLPVFTAVGSTRPPKFIYKKLAVDPSYFAKLVVSLCTPEDQDSTEEYHITELDRQRVSSIRDLLLAWDIVPGSLNGQIDYKKLQKWIKEARKLCKNAERIKCCDRFIGNVLTHVPPDENSNWPPEKLAKLIDKVESGDLEAGFLDGILEKIEVWEVSMINVNQKRQVAEQLSNFAAKLNILYPRTAKILQDAAKYHEFMAEWLEDDLKKSLEE